jgi:hypothetical protein
LSANINGLGGQQTPNNSNGFIPIIPLEEYFEWDAISPTDNTNSTIGFYFDARAGFEHVAADYASAVGLSKNNFLMAQISGGILVKGSFTISGQRYYGPAQSFVQPNGMPVTVKNYGWAFSLQFAPTQLAKAAKKAP